MTNKISSATYKRRFRRMLWLAIVFASVALYFPINHFVHGGVQLLLPFDQYFPLYPIFIIPYLLGSLLIIGLPAWAAFYAKSSEFEFYAVCILLGTWVSYVIYLAYPTFVARPEIVSKDILSSAISILYRTDRAYNAVPSGHAFYSTLWMLFLSRWKTENKLVWVACWIIILASTLFTRQHNLLDLWSGLALAAVVYWIGRHLAKKWNLNFAS